MTAPARRALRRFVIVGLRDTIDCYIAATLPLHRFTWELGCRLTELAEVLALSDHRHLGTLRAAHRVIAAVDSAVRAHGRTRLLADEHRAVLASIATLRATLSRVADHVEPRDDARTAQSDRPAPRGSWRAADRPAAGCRPAPPGQRRAPVSPPDHGPACPAPAAPAPLSPPDHGPACPAPAAPAPLPGRSTACPAPAGPAPPPGRLTASPTPEKPAGPDRRDRWKPPPRRPGAVIGQRGRGVPPTPGHGHGHGQPA